MILGARLNILFIFTLKIFMLVKWSYTLPPPIMLTIQFILVRLFEHL